MDDFIGKLKEIKGIKFIVLGIAVGLLLILIGSYSINTTKAKSEAPPQTETSEESIETYGRQLETRLELLIGAMDGVGAVRVMVVLESGSEYVYAKDAKGASSDEHVIIGSAASENPVVVKEISPKISGVAVVCRGISAQAKAEIIEIVRTLFSLPSNRVYVAG